MAITLFLEQPVGVRTDLREFTPGVDIRFTGKVTGIFGWPEFGLQVKVELRDKTGTVRGTWFDSTNWVGNYWIDTRVPTEAGSYTVSARVRFLTGGEETAAPVTFYVSLIPPLLGPRVQIDISPTRITVGNSVKAAVAVYLENTPEREVPVDFRIQDPNGAIVLEETKMTDSRGLAWVTLSPDMAGAWTFSVKVLKYGVQRAQAVSVLAQPIPPEPPTVPPDEPTPPPKAEFPKWVVPAAIAALALVFLAKK